ncbi:MAG: GAF domain-containing protein [Nitrospira sp.]
MAAVRRMVNRTIRKKASKPAASVARRKTVSRKVTPLSDDRVIRTLQQRLLETVSSSEQEGRSPIGVSAVFVQCFWQLTKVDAMAIYVRDEQTRDMTCLAEAGRDEASSATEWRKVLTRAEKQAQVTSGDLHAFRLHRIGRMEGLVMLQTGSSQRLNARQLLTVLTAIEPWLAVALDHARLTVKYAAKILRIQHMEQVSDVLNSSLAKEEKLRRALDAAIRLVEAEAGALFLKSEKGTLELYALSGERIVAVPSLQSSIAATVHRTGQPVLITQGAQDNRLVSQEGWLAAIPVASLVSVPVRAGVQAVGVLEVVNRRSGKPFSNWDVLELASLSNQFGLAIENLRRGAAGEGGSK